MDSQKFSAVINIINDNPYVRPPNKVLAEIFKQAGKKTGPIPVRGTLNDRNIERVLQHLRGEESDALYPLMHRKK